MEDINLTLAEKNNLLEEKIEKLWEKNQQMLNNISPETSLLEESKTKIGRKNKGPIAVKQEIIQVIENVQLEFENFLQTNDISIECLDGRFCLVDGNESLELDFTTVRKMNLLGIYLNDAEKVMAMGIMNDILINLTRTEPKDHTNIILANGVDKSVSKFLKERLSKIVIPKSDIIFSTLSDFYSENGPDLGVTVMWEVAVPANTPSEKIDEIREEMNVEFAGSIAEILLPAYFVCRIIANPRDAFQEEKALAKSVVDTFTMISEESSLGSIREYFMNQSEEFVLGETPNMAVVQKEDGETVRYIILDSKIYAQFIELIKRDIYDSAEKSNILYGETGLDNIGAEDSELFAKMATYDDDILAKNLQNIEKVPVLLAIYNFLRDLYKKEYRIEVKRRKVPSSIAEIEEEEELRNWNLDLILPYGKTIEKENLNALLNSYLVKSQVVDFEEVKKMIEFLDAERPDSDYENYITKTYQIKSARLRKVISHELNGLMDSIVDGDFSKMMPLIGIMEEKINALQPEQRAIVIAEIKQIIYGMQKLLPKEQFTQILNLASESEEVLIASLQNAYEVAKARAMNMQASLEDLKNQAKKIKIPTWPQEPRKYQFATPPTQQEFIMRLAQEYALGNTSVGNNEKIMY